MSIVRVKSSDSADQVFDLSPEVACLSGFIRQQLAESGGGEHCPVIILPTVSTTQLSQVVDYCTRWIDDPAPAEDRSYPWPERRDWEKEYLAKLDSDGQRTLMDLILAANLLDVKPLLDRACQCLAEKIKGKSTEEIRRTFNIKNDFTPEEEEAVIHENAWCDCV